MQNPQALQNIQIQGQLQIFKLLRGTPTPSNKSFHTIPKSRRNMINFKYWIIFLLMAIQEVKSRLVGPIAEIRSDAHPAYKKLVKQYFPDTIYRQFSAREKK